MALFLTACGGGSSESSSSTSSTTEAETSSKTYYAVDGRLGFADGYADMNTNGVADSGEYVGTTQEDGSLVLDSSYSTYPIIFKAIAGVTKDADYEGTITESYEMVAPAGQTVITPFTTLAHLNNMTMEDVLAQVDPDGTLGLDLETISGDYTLVDSDLGVTTQALARSLAKALTEELADNSETTLDSYVESIVETLETQVSASSDIASDLATMVITVESNNGVMTPAVTTTTALESANDSNSEEEEDNSNSGGGVIVIPTTPSEDDDEESETPVEDEVVEEETETPVEEEEEVVEEEVEEETETVTACYNDNEGATLVSKTISSADYAENLAKFDMPDSADLTITGIRPLISAHYSIVGITNVDTGERYQGLEFKNHCYYDIAVTEGTNLQFEVLELTDSEKAERGTLLNDSYSSYQGIHTIASTISGYEPHDLPLEIELAQIDSSGDYAAITYTIPAVMYNKEVTSGMLLENYSIRTENGKFNSSKNAYIFVNAHSLVTNQFGMTYADNESYYNVSNVGNDILADGVETTIYLDENITGGYMTTVYFMATTNSPLNEYNTRIELTVGTVSYDIEYKQGINIADEDRAEISLMIDADEIIGFAWLTQGYENYMLQFAN